MQEAQVNGKEIRQKIQAASATTLKKLSAEQMEKSSPEKVGLFMRQVRKLLEEGTQAMTWNDEQLENFTLQIALLRLGFETGMQYGNGLAIEGELNTDVKLQTENPRCSFECERLRNECISSECGNKTSWPCFCCVPCNASWMACLADCVMN